MQPLTLEDIPLVSQEVAICQKADLTDAAQILCKPFKNLTRTLYRYTDDDGIHAIHHAVSVAQCPPSRTLAQLLEENQADEAADGQAGASTSGRIQTGTGHCRTTGDAAIDRVLGGGFHRSALTEIVGKFAMGKSQILIQSAIYAALALSPITANTGDRIPAPTEATDDLYDILQGVGCLPPQNRVTVAMMTFEGHAEADMLLRRMAQMCDAVIEERFHLMEARRDQSTAHLRRSGSSSTSKRTRGGFAAQERRQYTLEEVQDLAQSTLMGNLRLAQPTSYAALLHTVAQDVPAMMHQLATSQQSNIGLILIDDVTRVINEAADNQGLRQHRSDAATNRSRLCCELSDALKRLIATDVLPQLADGPNSKPALVVVNHVMDTHDRQKDLLRSWGEVTAGAEGMDNDAYRQPTPPKAQDAGLSLTEQELHYSGLMAHLDPRVSATLPADPTRRMELVESMLSRSQLASMGLSWVNCINVRLFLCQPMEPQSICLPKDQHFRLRYGNLPTKHTFGVRRLVSVLNPFAPAGMANCHGVDFVICPSGIHSLESLNIEALPITMAEASSTTGNGTAEEPLWDSIDVQGNIDDEDWDLQMIEATQRAERDHHGRLTSRLAAE